MRITVFLLLFSVIQVMAKSSYSQSTKLSLNLKDVSIDHVLDEIEKKSEFYFLYNQKLVNVDRKVDVNIRNKKISDILIYLFEDVDVNYLVMDRQIVLSPRNIAERVDITREGQVQEAIEVKGTIVDSNGNPIPGVNIIIKGTNKGAISDANGNYTINVDDTNTTLVFSFIGMLSQEVQVGNQTEINITLNRDAIGLEEVVAIGYGTVKKVNLTGSVSSVSSEELTKRPVVNPILMLQGKVPGIQITQHSGAPGNEGAVMQIRGRRSFGTNNNPLVLVDGIQSSLTQLNPDMIESISVLKDASSAAIYGSRAANGVILVTTKKGKANNRLNIEYHTNFALHQPTYLPELITNSAEYMTLLNEAKVNSLGPGNESYTQEDIDAYRNNADNPMYPNTDWNKHIYRDGFAQTHYLSLNGGNEATTRFNLGLSYVDQTGVIRAWDAQKYNMLFNLTSKISKIVSLSTNVLLGQKKRHQTERGERPITLRTWGAHPTYGPRIVKDGPSKGLYARNGFTNVYNNQNPILAIENGGDAFLDNHAQVSVSINLKLLDGLDWETTGAAKLDFTSFKGTGYSLPVYNWRTGEYHSTVSESSGWRVTRRDTHEQFYNLFSTLKYNKLFAKKHQVNGLLGYSQENLRNDFLQGYRRNMPGPSTTELDAGGTLGQTAGGNAYEWAIQSLFGRVNYSYNNKYLFEASFRYDGSSRFSKGNQWGLFPSLGAAWKIHKESFISNSTWINELKLRATWGQLGNQEITPLGNQNYPYPYQEIMDIGLNYPWGSSVQSGAYLSRLSNNDITWETTTITDVGFDFSFFDHKFYGTLDYFNKATKDILRFAQVPGVVGLSEPTINGGKMKNEGFELLVGHRNRIGEFRYDVSFNLGSYKNTLTEFGEAEDGGTYINQEGSPWNSYYAWNQIGIFQSQAEIDAAPTHMYNPAPGDFRYEDVNNDGKIDSDDRIIIPGIFPKFDYGGSIFLEWKNFDLSAFIQGSVGKKYAVIFWGFEPFFQEGKPPTFWRNRWTPENPSTTLPRVYMPNAHPAINNFSSWWLQDASYVRLKNLQVGYNLPVSLCNKIGLQGIRVYYSGDNLFTITKFYKDITGAENVGSDPERTNNAGKNWNPKYPQLTIHSFGVKLSF